jgi:hypothetical protein
MSNCESAFNPPQEYFDTKMKLRKEIKEGCQSNRYTVYINRFGKKRPCHIIPDELYRKAEEYKIGAFCWPEILEAGINHILFQLGKEESNIVAVVSDENEWFFTNERYEKLFIKGD